jgi:hypothetical protein
MHIRDTCCWKTWIFFAVGFLLSFAQKAYLQMGNRFIAGVSLRATPTAFCIGKKKRRWEKQRSNGIGKIHPCFLPRPVARELW